MINAISLLSEYHSRAAASRPSLDLALWVDFPYHFACRRRRRSTVPAFPGLLVPCVRRTSHSISSENCTAAGSEMEHVFARAASAGRPAIAGRFEFVTPPTNWRGWGAWGDEVEENKLGRIQ